MSESKPPLFEVILATKEDSVSTPSPSASTPPPLSHFRTLFKQRHLTSETVQHAYSGNGSTSSPFIVEWLPSDPQNPQNWSRQKKWLITTLAALSCFTVSFTSSAYTGGIDGIMAEFHVPTPTALLGVSLFVAGFAIGPLIWAPMSEIYGRQIPFIITYGLLVVWNGAAAGSTSMRQLAVFRFLAGAFGSSPLTNAGGVIADIFSTEERGLAIGLFSVGPFMGPVMGPIVGGFLAESAGWRWVLWLVTLLCGIVFLAVTLSTPETYGPHLLRQRAIALTSLTGKHHVSSVEKTKGRPTLLQALKTGFSRPWQLLFLEPIVLIMAVYMAINFGTMFMMFAAYPIIFQQGRGWSVGTNGLTFIGILIGMLIAFGYLFAENRRYMQKLATQPPGAILPPEARLPPCMVGAVACPIGLFWFAWTNGPNLHWIICLVGTVPFGFGTVLLTTSGMNYLIDAYVVYAASAIAGVTVMRSVAGCAFPLFTKSMYEKLGLHWASSVPAFAALLCVPFPFLFYRWGPAIRKKCAFAMEAQRVLEQLRGIK